MKKTKIISSIIITLMLIIINSEVIAIHTASHVATHTAIHSSTTATMIALRNKRYRNSKSIEELAEQIYNETQNEELKNYIIENKQYLYLNSKEKAEAIIDKYKESNLEETKQFIKDNYYDKNKPKNEKVIVTIGICIIILLLIFGTVMVFIV